MSQLKTESCIDLLRQSFEKIEGQIENLKKIQKQYVIENGDYRKYEDHYYVLRDKMNHLEAFLFSLDDLIDQLQMAN